jgi:predicted hydrocarbon binding protein
MHGTILCGFRRFLVAEYGEDARETVHGAADVGGQLFVPVTEYPDAYYDELLRTASRHAGRDRAALERGFGRALADQHLDAHEYTETPDRTPLARLADLDDRLQTAFGSGGVDSKPSLASEKVDAHRVRLTYSSHRGFCTVVRGIVEGLAATLGADWTLEEACCIHDGASECRFVVSADDGSRPATATKRPSTPEVSD